MNVQQTTLTRSRSRSRRSAVLAVLFVTPVLVWPDFVFDGLRFSLLGLVAVSPLVIPGILLTAWIMASGADRIISRAFEGRILRAIVAASLIGAITPVCGVTCLPLMAGLLAAGVPLAPVLAFWLSSPVTDPAMLATTAATLGLAFAIGKTVAAFGLGLFGGAVTAAVSRQYAEGGVLRTRGLASDLATGSCCGAAAFEPRIWREQERRSAFYRQA